LQVAELPGDSIFAWKVLQDPVNLIDPEVLQSVDSFNARLQSAIARGDVHQLETMKEA
jgi:hypothetical protein